MDRQRKICFHTASFFWFFIYDQIVHKKIVHHLVCDLALLSIQKKTSTRLGRAKYDFLVHHIVMVV